MKEFSTSWNSSKLPRKQRKYRLKAPLHHKQKLLCAPLSKSLRSTIKRRSLQLRTGDKVKVLRGDLKGKEGKIERVNLKRQRVYITGLERKKKDGSSSLYPFQPSNLVITETKMDDKKRKKKTTTTKTKNKPIKEEKQ